MPARLPHALRFYIDIGIGKAMTDEQLCMLDFTALTIPMRMTIPIQCIRGVKVAAASTHGIYKL